MGVRHPEKLFIKRLIFNSRNNKGTEFGPGGVSHFHLEKVRDDITISQCYFGSYRIE